MQIGFINIHCYERDMNFKGDEEDTGIDVRGDQYNRILPVTREMTRLCYRCGIVQKDTAE
jgi:hypothetical protein